MGKFIINILCIAIVVTGIFFLYSYLEEHKVFSTFFEYYRREHTILNKNAYSISTQNNFVKITDDFTPENKQDLLNIYYTIFASGMNNFTFFCSKEYEECINDIQSITKDNLLLSHINNFVHPFNSYKSVKTSYTNGGKVVIIVRRIYTKDEINEINAKVDDLYKTLVSKNKTVEENIKSVHDYIINHAKYDTEYINNNSTFESNNAYGPLFEGYAICSGYTDLMGIFLDKMGIINHKVSNDKHVWNLVYINDEWLHLDLTWDDPVTTNGKDYLKHDYFLVTTEELKELDNIEGKTEHVFEESIYTH